MEPDKEKCHRPKAFDKMEGLVREMQDAENGVPVRSQKLFLTSIPSAFMGKSHQAHHRLHLGYDLIEWLMERLSIEESEALNLANQLCQYGYFFPVSDSKNLVVKDDSSLYRFQSPYYWPYANKAPDNIDYAVYLSKRSMRNKQRHALDDHELETLGNLRKNLANKWDFITIQAEEQLGKVLKKGEKIISDSQERAYWRIHRPPPGQISSLEQCPVPPRSRNGNRTKKRTVEDGKREVDILKASLSRTRVKVSQALESMVQYVETYSEYDPIISGTQPSNPWVSEDLTYWQLNSPLVEIPTEKRVKRWGLSMEELVSDPTGLQEFTNYLRKEYSHENIRFWMAVNDLRRSAQSQIQRKVNEIFEEFLAPGAPCEINIDGKTMERVHQEMRSPSRFTFDSAQDHVYTLLLKKDCYPRFIRSEHYKNLLAVGIQPTTKKRFFGFGQQKKKTSTSSAPNPALLQQQQQSSQPCGISTGALSKRRGSDRSLSGSAHELAVSGVRGGDNRVPHSHSQSNLSDIPYRGDLPGKSRTSTTAMTHSPVKKPGIAVTSGASTSEDVCPWEAHGPEPRSRKNSTQMDSGSSASDICVAVQVAAEVTDPKVKKAGHLPQQSTMDGGKSSRKLSAVCCIEPRRASVSVPIDRKIFEEVSKVPTPTPAPTPTPPVPNKSDVDNKSEEICRTFRKSLSVAGAANAPTISVSSATDDGDVLQEAGADVVDPKVDGAEDEKPMEERLSAAMVEEEEDEEQDHKRRTEPEVVISRLALAPLAEPDSESPISELPPEPNFLSEEAKSNDVCPWEDEETKCNVDGSFRKTYTTLGFL
ncbi:PREDICTED: regulator of G-protein signaling 11 isoform X2 [Nicrophorus vespilloides]|uniref:Regulator of G-protein signaling 11 isoform X2 n=1 Tax=Nicrophorus vespilloides TaxID=110193 RepID=A0ABM1M8Q4_NICVS|nr:PREDICTED: regulator of G-protein signaling 11 isoform X2 [Nicrophorus vespilloides]